MRSLPLLLGLACSTVPYDAEEVGRPDRTVQVSCGGMRPEDPVAGTQAYSSRFSPDCTFLFAEGLRSGAVEVVGGVPTGNSVALTFVDEDGHRWVSKLGEASVEVLADGGIEGRFDALTTSPDIEGVTRYVGTFDACGPGRDETCARWGGEVRGGAISWSTDDFTSPPDARGLCQAVLDPATGGLIVDIRLSLAAGHNAHAMKTRTCPSGLTVHPSVRIAADGISGPGTFTWTARDIGRDPQTDEVLHLPTVRLSMPSWTYTGVCPGVGIRHDVWSQVGTSCTLELAEDRVVLDCSGLREVYGTSGGSFDNPLRVEAECELVTR